jgi:hypothetical protein
MDGGWAQLAARLRPPDGQFAAACVGGGGTCAEQVVRRPRRVARHQPTASRVPQINTMYSPHTASAATCGLHVGW